MLRRGLGSLARLAQRAGRSSRACDPETLGTPGSSVAQARRWAWNSSRGQYQHFQARQAVFDIRSPTTLRVLAAMGGGSILVFTVSQQEVPYTGRMHAILISKSAELAMGDQTYAGVLEEARAAGTLVPAYHPAARRVERIGRRLEAVVERGGGGGHQDHMKGLDWRFSVINSPQVNAFVVPGGKVVVFTGLLAMVATDDELAAVLAHECAHVLARHAAERMTQGGVVSVLQMVAYWGFGIPLPSDILVPAFFLPNSRKAETEADVIGIQLAAQACYDPAAAVTVFEKLGREEKKAGGASIPKFLRTHPVSDARVKRIQEELPKARGLYELAGCEGVRGQLSSFQSMFL